MLIFNENNRTGLNMSVAEALELIGELSKAIQGANVYGARATNGMPASEHIADAKYKPSSFTVTVTAQKDGRS